MVTSSHFSGIRDHALLWALLFSLTLHIILALRLPNLEFDKAVPEPLKVELTVAPKPQPKPEPVPEPKIEPEQPKQVVKPKLEPKPSPAPARLTQAPAAEPPASTQPEPAITEPPPAVIAAAPKVDSPPTFTAPPPPPDPPKPSGPSQQDIDAARSLYGNLLAREITKYKQYPKIAQMRNWQGETVVDLHLDGSGNVITSKIQQSSGFDVLDKQALEMVKKASPFPAAPDALRGRSFNILVPVSFRLE